MGEERQRHSPRDELDFYLMTTDGKWGEEDINPQLKEKLTKYFATVDDKGNKGVYKNQLWGLLGFYTRDMRLANLSTWNGELEYCQYYLDLANDFLQCDMIRPFLISLSRVATMLELSQSKDGFLRKKMGTLRTENITGTEEPPKKGLFGGKSAGVN